MAEPCDQVERCSLSERFRSPTVLEVFKIRYCNKGGAGCARLAKIRDGVQPPDELLPDGGNLVELRPPSASLAPRRRALALPVDPTDQELLATFPGRLSARARAG